MLTTLWVMTIAAVVAMGAALAGRNAVSAGSNRVQLERARWTALGCARRAEAAIDEALRAAPGIIEGAEAWRALDRRIAGSGLIGPECDVTLEAAGTRLDVNAASEEMISNLLVTTGESEHATELAAALADWRDSDDVERPLGAERAWYDAAHRFAPRNAPIADIRELRRIRGYETARPFDSLVTTEPGRVSLATAPVPVLMSVPGITRETAERIAELQLAGTPPSDLLVVVSSISEASASTLASRYPEAVRATTPDPDAWIIRSRVSRGEPAATVVLEWRVTRADKRCVIASTKSNT